MTALITVFFCFVFLLAQNRVHASTCESQYYDESKQVTENNFANISYSLNIIEGPQYLTNHKAVYNVCQGEKISLQCMFVWNKESSKVTVMHWVSRNETICFAKHGDLSNPAFKFEMHISLLVKRSFKLIELSIADGDELYKPLRIFHLDVLYPPKVNVLTVDGHEVREVYLIDEDQKVTVVCSFDKGNPPTQFRLLDRRGKDLKSVTGADNISHSFAVKCEDDWPNVRCEGVGSKCNRSVSFLVTCPPHFVDSHRTISPGLREVALRVKAHSTVTGGCYLTSGLSSSNVIQKTNCTVSGNPPDLVLNLYLGKENETTEGNWTLTFRNERGFANATIIVTNGPDLSSVDLLAELVFHIILLSPFTHVCAESRLFNVSSITSFLHSVAVVVLSVLV